MATRSTISLLTKSGEVKSIYCHFDGYLSGVGETLLNHYKTYEKVEELINLGSISVLGEQITPPEGKEHSFDKPLDNVTIAYHRDRKEALSIEIYSSLEIFQLTGHHQNQSYNYIFMSDKWYLVVYNTETNRFIRYNELN